MASQAESIGSHNLDARLSIANPADELGTLGHAFNRLLERLAAALQQQRVFMAEASHQLRTPVSVIRTAAQVMLSREHRPEEEYRESLDVVARQAQRLTKSVDDMFILALADAQARPLHVAPLYFDELVGEVIDDLRVVADSRQVTLRGDSAGEAPLVGDEYLLRQMLTNLIENAIRYAPRGGTVTVMVRLAPATLTVTVTDTGPGIAPSDADRIFERFVHLDRPGSESGGGLGLPIARWIAEAHGGTLLLASTGPAGSQFVITLPQSSSVHP
jgi:two-component system, OmpR family, sensor kinase